jgi:hypothetical protein
MIVFIGTSLQLESIKTAHTLKSFWTTSVWRISRDWTLLDWTNFHADRIAITMSYSSSVILCFIRCHETCVSLMTTLWFIQAYSLLQNALLANRCLAVDYSVTIYFYKSSHLIIYGFHFSFLSRLSFFTAFFLSETDIRMYSLITSRRPSWTNLRF